MATAPVATLPKGVSEEDILRGLKLLEQQKVQRAKQKEKAVAKTPEQKEKQAANNKRHNAVQRLTLAKAIAAGIKVTEKEIDEYLAKQVVKA